MTLTNKAVIKALEKGEEQIVNESAEEMGETQEEVWRMFFGRCDERLNGSCRTIDRESE